MLDKYLWLALTGTAILVSGCGAATTQHAPTNGVTNTAQAGNNATSNVSTAPRSATSQWLTFQNVSRTAIFTVIAGYQGKQGGMNFNGYSNGAMTLAVPVNWTVQINFHNEDEEPHSAEIVPYSQRQSTTFKPAFPSATTPNAATGVSQGGKQSFQFTATTAGTYALVCGVPGHSDAGMWDKFVVSTTIHQPSVVTTQ